MQQRVLAATSSNRRRSMQFAYDVPEKRVANVSQHDAGLKSESGGVSLAFKGEVCVSKPTFSHGYDVFHTARVFRLIDRTWPQTDTTWGVYLRHSLTSLVRLKQPTAKAEQTTRGDNREFPTKSWFHQLGLLCCLWHR